MLTDQSSGNGTICLTYGSVPAPSGATTYSISAHHWCAYTRSYIDLDLIDLTDICLLQMYTFSDGIDAFNDCLVNYMKDMPIYCS